MLGKSPFPKCPSEPVKSATISLAAISIVGELWRMDITFSVRRSRRVGT